MVEIMVKLDVNTMLYSCMKQALPDVSSLQTSRALEALLVKLKYTALLSRYRVVNVAIWRWKRTRLKIIT